MAQPDNDISGANQGGPNADIPDLKRKDKERKRGGAAWFGARGAGAGFNGAAGGAASAFGGDAAAGFGSGIWGTVSRFLAGLTSTLLGKAVVAAAALLLAAGAGLLGRALLSNTNAGLGAPNLGAISDSLSVRGPRGDRLGVNSKGEIKFDPDAPGAKQTQAQNGAAETAKAAEAPAAAPDAVPEAPAGSPFAERAGRGFGQDFLAHNMSGSKLSSNLGNQFGGKNIFADSNSAAPRFSQNLGKVNVAKIGGKKGTLSPISSKRTSFAAAPHATSRAHSGRAIAQLKLAKGMSMMGAQSGTGEGAAQSANGAFDQQQTHGGEMSGISMPGEVVNPAGTGTGAPDLTMPSAPGAPTGDYLDPGLQNSLSQLGSMADQARQMMQQGTMLMILGAALIALGAYLLTTPFSAWIGGIIIALGVMVVGMGNSMKKSAASMAEMTKASADALATQIGNKQQGDIIKNCTDQAYNEGTAVKDCTNPESITRSQEIDAREKSDIQKVKAIPNSDPKFDQ